MHLGVFGGSFDPVHNGHTIVARAVKAALKLDVLHIIPTHQHPFKHAGHSASPADRFEMLKIAFQNDSGILIDGREIERAGTSYTADTLREIRQQHVVDRLSLIVGADTMVDFASWRQHDAILQLADVVVMTRPGENPANNAGFTMLEVPPVAISATEIRARLRQGSSVKEMLPPGVLEYIQERGLYGSGV